MRCLRCRLLKHTLKHCYLTDEQAKISKEISQDKNKSCMDCTLFNENNSKTSFTKLSSRDVNHPTNHSNCPTLKLYIKRYLSHRHHNIIIEQIICTIQDSEQYTTSASKDGQ